MPSIDEIILDELPGIMQNWEEQEAKIHELLANLTEVLSENDWLLDFEETSTLPQKTMVAIDGGNISDKLQMGDLIVTGATAAEAHESKQFFDDPRDIPSEAFIRLLPHRTDNTHLHPAVRAAQELIVLDKVKHADIKIIDGSYLGNVSEIMARLASDDEILAEIVEQELYPKNLSNIIHELLNPPRSNDSGIISVVKSDTSPVYANVFKEKFDANVGLMGDRIIADRILKPGQFLAPRYLDSNPQLIDLITRRKRNGVLYDNGMKISMMDELITDNIEHLERMRSTDADITNEGILWTTYFKPTSWGMEDKSIRIEFPYYRSKNGKGETIRQFAGRMVALVNEDVFNSDIREPWCQYAVDIEAKKVSNAMKMAKMFFESNASQETYSRLQSYRS